LREASKRLTTEVRKNWTQGKDLEFHLEYVNNDVRLSVKDTAKTVTAVADRSDGFTAYFAMRMLLVARTKQTAPNGYIFLFDEPGLNLHPKGQVDLQNVFEDIAQNNQIIYTTHSVFLINKNFPTRNHLVYKNEHGSNIDTKPFIGGWAKVKEHLGLYLSANFLFADKILLAEGPTDDIYLPSIIQGLISRGHFDGDLNALAIRAGLNSKDMLAVASTYISEERAVTVLVDGDIEGEQRKSRIEKWAASKKKKCPVLILSEYCKAPCAIENFLEPTLYTDAVIAASKHLTDDGTLATPAGEWQTELKKLLATDDNHTLGKRAENATKTILGEAISDVLIAIKYAEVLQKAEEQKPTPEYLTNYWAGAELRRLANALWSTLGLPMRADTNAIPLTT
jgi:predicted ATP-dependent endonuclease of OLD family